MSALRASDVLQSTNWDFRDERTVFDVVMLNLAHAVGNQDVLSVLPGERELRAARVCLRYWKEFKQEEIEDDTWITILVRSIASYYRNAPINQIQESFCVYIDSRALSDHEDYGALKERINAVT